MKLRVIFQNMCQGMHFAGEKNDKSVFYKFGPSSYIDLFRDFEPDIACFAEFPLDDVRGNSIYANDFSKELGLPYFKIYVNEKSWLIEGKYYGTVILSRHPINEYVVFELPNPELEIDHKDGTHWVMHDKAAQKVKISVGGATFNIYNLHYFPFHHFDRKINEPEFENIRKTLGELLVPEKYATSIVCGDFNNK